jgi:hypothetical protein
VNIVGRHRPPWLTSGSQGKDRFVNGQVAGAIRVSVPFRELELLRHLKDVPLRVLEVAPVLA